MSTWLHYADRSELMFKLFSIVVLLFVNVSLASTNSQQIDSPPLVSEVAEYERLLNSKFALFLHKRNYILPITYIWNPSEEIYDSITSGATGDRGDFYSHQEAEFQFSFFIPVYRKPFSFKGDLIAAYTHHSWWQVYNTDWSKPFRETNYNPELFYRRVNPSLGKIFGLDMVAYDFGYMHQSNGQVQQLSRSWDRIFFRTLLTNKSLSFVLSAWARLPERPGQDDNTDIVGYMGSAEIEIKKNFSKLTIETKVPLARKPGVELNLSYPWENHFRWFVSGQVGYGHSLIEYDRDTSRLGIGFTLNSFLDNQEQ